MNCRSFFEVFFQRCLHYDSRHFHRKSRRLLVNCDTIRKIRFMILNCGARDEEKCCARGLKQRSDRSVTFVKELASINEFICRT